MINEALYRTFLHDLLSGDRARCTAVVNELLDQDISITSLYLDLYQRAMYEVGELWETNRISVAVEHLATSVIESLLPLAYPRIFGAEHVGKKAIISCVANEYHQIGGKMVADFFELNGWDGYFLGANTPVDALLRMIAEKHPDLLGLSLSIYFNMSNLHTVMGRIRADFPALPVIVGGQAFRWGGADICHRFEHVTLVTSMDQLQSIINRG